MHPMDNQALLPWLFCREWEIYSMEDEFLVEIFRTFIIRSIGYGWGHVVGLFFEPGTGQL